MPSAESVRETAARRSAVGALLLVLGACSGPPPAPVAPAPSVQPPRPPAIAPEPARPAAPPTLRSQQALERYAAQRLAEVNADKVYHGKPPDILLAVPVLRVDLHPDGRVRRITVLREPKQAKDTIQIAMAAVHKAAPYGDVSKLPEPRMFVETFLFNDARHFKPRGLQ